MPVVTTLSPVTIYQSFSQPISISAGITGETISSITVTKAPTSVAGAGTSYAYRSLTLNGNDFKTVDSLNFTYGAGTSQISFTLAGTYTDYLFSDQLIKYYDNPNNVSIGTGFSTNIPSISYGRTVSNDAANPKVNSYIGKSISYSKNTAPNNIQQFYYSAISWEQLRLSYGSGYTVSAVYSFTPSASSSKNYTYTLNITYSNSDPIYGFGAGTSSLSVQLTHQVNYDINVEISQLNTALSNQRSNGFGVKVN